MSLTLAAVFHFSNVTIGDVLAALGIAMLGVIGWRWKRGDFWRETAEERGARITELERRVHELETGNHTLAVEVAKLQAQPSYEGLFELLKEHDMRESDTARAIAKHLEESTAVLHGITVQLGELIKATSNNKETP